MGNGIFINKDQSGRLTVSFRYDPAVIENIRMIQGRRWHPEGKYRSVPYTEGIIEKILKAFDGEEECIDPALQSEVVIAPTLARGGDFLMNCNPRQYYSA